MTVGVLVPLEAEALEKLSEHEELKEHERLDFEAGFKATFDIGLDLSDAQVSASDSAGGGGTQ